MDCGKELNAKIKRVRQSVNDAQDTLFFAEEELSNLLREREKARKECNRCDNCSVCLG